GRTLAKRPVRRHSRGVARQVSIPHASRHLETPRRRIRPAVSLSGGGCSGFCPIPAGRGVILFDLSRLVSRAGRETPTGIDRVELAYAEHLAAASTPLCFTILTRPGRFGPLPRTSAEDYIGAIAGAWRNAAAPSELRQAERL